MSERLHISSYAWIVLTLTVAAILSRLYTTNSLAGEPTSDEYLYAVHARDLARAWAAGATPALAALSVEGRSVAFEAAALSFVLPWDVLTIGRTVQALMNALCVPMTFVLSRLIGLPRAAAVAAAVLLLAVPQFQESAWRFWIDSQATLLSLVYLSAFVLFVRRPSWIQGAVAVASLGGLVITKESAAVTLAPLLALAVSIPLSRRVTGSDGRAIALVGAVMLIFGAGFGVLLMLAPSDLANVALFQKTFAAGPMILSSMRNAVPRLPTYLEQLAQLLSMRDLGSGFLCATLVGYAWLLAQAAAAVSTARPSASTRLGWIVAAMVWLVGTAVSATALTLSVRSDAWVVAAAGALLAVVGTVGLHVRRTWTDAWGLALLGIVVLVFIAERLLILVTPNVSMAAVTFRSLMPTVPLYATLAAGGLWAVAAALALLVPSVRSAGSMLTIVGAVALVAFWSPLLRERFSSQPLIGRVADRGADAETPQGLRVEALVAAEDWLKANLQPNDAIITGIPRHLAWYADLGVDGLEGLIDLGSQPRNQEQRREYILDRVGPRGATYVVDFNVNWTDPGGETARQWRQTYDILVGRPNLEPVYVRRDRFGHPVLYVIRNHGYAQAPAR